MFSFSFKTRILPAVPTTMGDTEFEDLQRNHFKTHLIFSGRDVRILRGKSAFQALQRLIWQKWNRTLYRNEISR